MIQGFCRLIELFVSIYLPRKLRRFLPVPFLSRFFNFNFGESLLINDYYLPSVYIVVRGLCR
jgi:hypothetical protein